MTCVVSVLFFLFILEASMHLMDLLCLMHIRMICHHSRVLSKRKGFILNLCCHVKDIWILFRTINGNINIGPHVGVFTNLLWKYGSYLQDLCQIHLGSMNILSRPRIILKNEAPHWMTVGMCDMAYNSYHYILLRVAVTIYITM